MKSIFLLGIGFEVLSTITGTAGKQLIRLSEITKRQAPGCSRVIFYVGIAIHMFAGPTLDMAAYSFAPQSLVAPFGGLDVIWNAALAPYILKEKLTRSRIIACTLIFLGTVGSGLFGSHQDEEYTIDSLKEKIFDVRVPIYLAGVLSLVVFNMLVPMRRPKGDIYRGVAIGTTGGVIAGNMFCVKAAVELIETSIWRNDSEVWTHWLTYVMIAGVLFFASTNVWFMIKGLLEFEALFMVTLFEGCMIVSNCVSASVILLELNGLEDWRIMCYWGSVGLVVSGMVQICVSEAGSAKKKLEEGSIDNENEVPMATVCGAADDEGEAALAVCQITLDAQKPGLADLEAQLDAAKPDAKVAAANTVGSVQGG